MIGLLCSKYETSERVRRINDTQPADSPLSHGKPSMNFNSGTESYITRNKDEIIVRSPAGSESFVTTIDPNLRTLYDAFMHFVNKWGMS